MNTFLNRLNVIFFFFVTTMVAMAALSGVSVLYATPNPPVSASITNTQLIRYIPTSPRYRTYFPTGNLYNLKFDLGADLRGLFNWNVKQLFVWITADYVTPESPLNQVTIWDTIIESSDKVDAEVYERNVEAKYPLSDLGAKFRGVPLNLTLRWEAAPITGLFLRGSRVTGSSPLGSITIPVKDGDVHDLVSAATVQEA